MLFFVICPRCQITLLSLLLATPLCLSGCSGAAGGALLGAAGQMASKTNDTPVTPVQPYQAGDEKLSCADLNQEIGRIQERMSRLMEQNEKAEMAKAQQSSFVNHLQNFGIMSVVTYPVSSAFHSASSANKEKYGTEDTRIVQTYQERVRHLETLGKSKGC